MSPRITSTFPIQRFSDQVGSCGLFKESLHLTARRSLFLLPIPDVHSVILLIQTSFFSADIFTTHLNFLIPPSATQSFTFNTPPSHSLAFLSTCLAPPVILPILSSATAISMRTFLVLPISQNSKELLALRLFKKFPFET